jgi:hypothetical protein
VHWREGGHKLACKANQAAKAQMDAGEPAEEVAAFGYCVERTPGTGVPSMLIAHWLPIPSRPLTAHSFPHADRPCWPPMLTAHWLPIPSPMLSRWVKKMNPMFTAAGISALYVPELPRQRVAFLLHDSLLRLDYVERLHRPSFHHGSQALPWASPGPLQRWKPI